jgi:hypothetical protein
MNTLFSVWGFVDDHTFITKRGGVGAVYRMRGLDYEGMDDATRQVYVHRCEA